MCDDQAVLVVEDEDLIREISGEALEDAGFDVILVETGDGALEALDDCADPFCAIVTDVNLGEGANGWDVARRGRELNDTMPVVYVTGGSAHQWEAEGVPNSILLTKPYSSSQMVGAVASLLKKDRA